MAQRDIAQATAGDQTGALTEFSIPSVSTDGPTGKDTEYTNTDWADQFGKYMTIAELRSAIDVLARWTMGDGIQAEPQTELLLMEIRGFGKDSFITILENMDRVAEIGGDSYAEIIRQGEQLLNLKPLDPGTMTIIANEQGIITGYKQTAKTGKETKFAPEDIFHISRNRTADEIHGRGLVDAVEDIILWRAEAMSTQATIVRMFAKPRFIFHLDTDNQTKIDAYIAKMDAAYANSENIYVPKDTVVPELIAVPANSMMNLSAWIRELNGDFYKAANVPMIIVGGSMEMTEATTKIAFISFEQVLKERRREREEQVLAQLNIEIKILPSVSLQNEMLSMMDKQETPQASTPEDTSISPVQTAQPAVGGPVGS